MDLALAVVGLLLVGVVASVVRIALGARPASEPTRSLLHPGIRISAVPVSGAAGLIFVLGYSWMFLAFTRQMWPWLLSLAVLGVLLGVASAARQRHASPGTPPLSLTQEQPGSNNDQSPQRKR